MEVHLMFIITLTSMVLVICGQQNVTEPGIIIPIVTTTRGITPSTNITEQKEEELLVANYDNPEHRLKAFTLRQPLVLHCNITKETDHQLIWEKHGKDVSKVDALEGRYVIIEPENKFIIQRTEETDAGHYSCRLNSTKKEFRTMADVAVRTPANIGVSENENLAIECVVVGTRPQLYWQIGNLTIYNSTDRYILKENADGVDNGILRLLNVSLGDSGEYKCIARNTLTDLNISQVASDVTYVRVKDKNASLWPAIGICAELLILCITTVIFKKLDKDAVLDEGDD